MVLSFFKECFRNARNDNNTNSNQSLKEANIKNDLINDIKLYRDNKAIPFPSEFERDKYLTRAREIYEEIGENKFIHEIRLVCSMCDSGQTNINFDNDDMEITISISAIKVGIGSGLGVTCYSKELSDCFSDVLAHELFHADSAKKIIEKYGIQEFKRIKCSKNVSVNRAWINFDEYLACYKNADIFRFTQSCESLEKAEKILKYIDVYKNCINQLLYTISTLIATNTFSDDKNKPSSNSIVYDIYNRMEDIFSKAYQELPLNYIQYENLGKNLQQIIESIK